MSGLPTGMFLPGSSLIHRIDARVKFLALLLFITAVVCADSPAGYVLMLAFTGAALLLSELPLKNGGGLRRAACVVFRRHPRDEHLFLRAGKSVGVFLDFQAFVQGTRPGL